MACNKEVVSKGTYTTLQTEASFPGTFYGDSVPYDDKSYQKYLCEKGKLAINCCNTNVKDPIGSGYLCTEYYAPAYGVTDHDLVKKCDYKCGYDPVLPCRQNEVTYHSHHQDILSENVKCQRLSQEVINELACKAKAEKMKVGKDYECVVVPKEQIQDDEKKIAITTEEEPKVAVVVDTNGNAVIVKKKEPTSTCDISPNWLMALIIMAFAFYLFNRYSQ